jgi:hypothetical protein
MKQLLLCTVLLFTGIASYAQEEPDAIDLSKIAQLQVDNQDKINAAFVAMDAVQKAGKYIESLSDLFAKGELTLPVGIKKGGNELIIQKITQDEKTKKSIIHATLAFQFKDTGQRIAFEGEAVLEGNLGFGTAGQLTLIAPVERKLGKHSSLIVREGTKVKFGCDGFDSFDARLVWMVTSDLLHPN